MPNQQLGADIVPFPSLRAYVRRPPYGSLGKIGLLSRALNNLIDLLAKGKPIHLTNIVAFFFDLCADLAEVGVDTSFGKLECALKGSFRVIHRSTYRSSANATKEKGPEAEVAGPNWGSTTTEKLLLTI